QVQQIFPVVLSCFHLFKREQDLGGAILSGGKCTPRLAFQIHCRDIPAVGVQLRRTGVSLATDGVVGCLCKGVLTLPITSTEIDVKLSLRYRICRSKSQIGPSLLKEVFHE